jgi:hypothetical protein
VALWPLSHLSLRGARQRGPYTRRDTSPCIGRAKPPTWRSKLIKVAATVVQSTRRIMVLIAS